MAITALGVSCISAPTLKKGGGGALSKAHRDADTQDALGPLISEALGAAPIKAPPTTHTLPWQHPGWQSLVQTPELGSWKLTKDISDRLNCSQDFGTE